VPIATCRNGDWRFPYTPRGAREAAIIPPCKTRLGTYDSRAEGISRTACARTLKRSMRPDCSKTRARSSDRRKVATVRLADGALDDQSLRQQLPGTSPTIPPVLKAAAGGTRALWLRRRLGYASSAARKPCIANWKERLSAYLSMEDAILYSSCFDANGGFVRDLARRRGRRHQR